MIKIENMHKTFYPGTVNENHAIKDINLSINENDFITIIGSNGAGKSTLFNLISGNIISSKGSININSKDVTLDPEYKRAKYIGRIFQDPRLGTASNMSIQDNMIIAYKKGMKGLRSSLNKKIKNEFRDRLSLLNMNLENRLEDNVGLLSGGQRQALTLLMVVMSKPDLILLDEHTAALDPKNAEIVQDLTLKFVKEHNLTAMMITHNMQHAIEFGNRLFMMDKGKIIFDTIGQDKSILTKDDLIKKFQELSHSEFDSDEALLTE